MSKQALKRVRREIGIEVNREPLPCHSEGYPLYYVFADGGACCADCANENIVQIDDDIKGKRVWNSHGGWALAAADVNYEDGELCCDHCSKAIGAAYVD